MFFIFEDEEKTDLERGKFVFDRMIHFYKRVNGNSFTSKELAVANRMDETILISGLGFSYRIGLDDNASKLDLAMESLAKKSGGRIPAKATIDAALRGAAQSYTFTEAATAVIKGSAVQLGEDLKEVGDNVISAVKIAPFMLLLIGGGYIAYKIYQHEKKS